MRPFLYIFTFYLLFLSVQPCGDLVPADAPDQAAFGQANFEKQAPSGPDDCPDPGHECSPFCICSCRQVPAAQEILTAAPDQETKIIVSVLPKTAFQNNYSHQLTGSIWQPPKNNSIV
jgi:hypothetical protein